MSDARNIKLSDYKRDARDMGELIHQPLSALANIIRYDNMILGTMPMSSDEGESIDFLEISPYIDNTTRTFSNAVLITGESGTGKRTLEKYFAWKFYNQFMNQIIIEDKSIAKTDIINECISYYKIDSYDMICDTNEKSCDRINEIFRQIISVCREEEKIKFISFGDVTDILDGKKTAKNFIRGIRKITEEPMNMCVITCICDTPASKLKERIKAPFIVENMQNPDDNTRQAFFTHFITNHKNIVFDIGLEKISCDDKQFARLPKIDSHSKELSKMTEGFSFKMLERLAKNIVISAKGDKLTHLSIYYNDKAYMDFVGAGDSKELPDSNKFVIEKSEIEKIIENIRGNIYVALPAKNMIPFVAGSVVPENNIVTEIKPEQKKNSMNDEIEKIKKEVCDTPEQLKSEYDKLPKIKAVSNFSGNELSKEDSAFLSNLSAQHSKQNYGNKPEKKEKHKKEIE